MQASQQRYQTLAQAIPQVIIDSIITKNKDLQLSQLIWISKADGFVEWANDQVW